MSGPAGHNCGNCRFWRRRSDRAGEMGGGYCVRFPPFAPAAYTVIPAIYDQREQIVADGHLNDAFPNVHQQSWCGEHKYEDRT